MLNNVADVELLRIPPAEFWLGLQADYDIRMARGKLAKIDIKPHRRTVARPEVHVTSSSPCTSV